MSPSSLIFVAVIAIWVTYLFVHVARRREHLATARTVDRFSAQMRVLQRRAVRVASAAPVADSARSSSRPLRTRPLVAATSADVFLTADAITTTSVEIGSAATLAATVATVDAADTVIPPRVAAASVADATDASLYRKRRLRVCTLLLASLAALVTGVLAGLGLLPWYVPVAVVAVVAAVLWWLRLAAVSEQQARRRKLAVERRARQRAVARMREAALEARPSAPVMPVAQEHVERRAGPVDAAGALVTQARTEAIAVADTSVLPAIDLLLEDREWAPTPVPPPTYTLKARAERPMPEPLEVPVPIDVDDDEIAWDHQRHQPRVVNA